MTPLRIVLMDLAPDICPEGHCRRLPDLLQGFLNAQGVEICTLTHLPTPLPSPPPDLTVLRIAGAMRLSSALRTVKHAWQTTPVVGLFCTARHTLAAVLHSLCSGLDDFLCCPFRDIDFLPRIQRFLPQTEAQQESLLTATMQAHMRRAGLVGQSVAFLRVVERVLRVAHADATVLLAGETGTGKELVARAVHYSSPRHDKPFVPVNCGALPDHLVENELFGHMKGAYTDATTAEKGLIAEAEGGTLFLDEVDTLSASAQVKLLRFLQDREYRPLGSSRHRTADIRIIAATNADLWHQVRLERFREDLYYRLNVIALCLPPLRQRPEDISRLAGHFLRRYGRQYGRAPQQLSAAALRKLEAYAWPGNIRELETVMQRTVLLTSAPVVCPDAIELPLQEQRSVPHDASFREAKARVIEQFERTYLVDILARHGGNVTQAAKQAGKERRAFTRLLQKYDLQAGAFRG